jgi:hypothetical protein
MKLSEAEYRRLFLFYEPYTPVSVITWGWTAFDESGQATSDFTEKELTWLAAMLSVYEAKVRERA